jgi:hypothetical protein
MVHHPTEKVQPGSLAARQDRPAAPHRAAPPETDEARIIAARLYALHGPPASYRPRGWYRGDAAHIARVLTACEHDEAFLALSTPEQRRARLYVRSFSEAAGIAWPRRRPHRTLPSEQGRTHAADRAPERRSRGGAA